MAKTVHGQPVMDDAAVRASYEAKISRHGDFNAVLDAGQSPLSRRGNIYYDFATKRIVLERLAPRPGDVILDFGTGVGRLARVIAPLAKEVVGVDVTPAMLDIAKKSTPRNASFHLIENGRIPAKDDTFDKALACWVLASISDSILPVCLSEIHRTLKTEGTFLALEQTVPHSLIESAVHKKRSVAEYRELFEASGFRVESSDPVIRSPSYAMSQWKARTYLPTLLLPLLWQLEKATLLRKPQFVDYYTTAFTLTKK